MVPVQQSPQQYQKMSMTKYNANSSKWLPQVQASAEMKRRNQVRDDSVTFQAQVQGRNQNSNLKMYTNAVIAPQKVKANQAVRIQ